MNTFGTAGIRGPVSDVVTPALALRVGQCIARSGETVVVGRDGRVTGQALEAAIIGGILSGGASVTRLGCVPTPTLAYASRGTVGVMLTASHNPPADNGIKLFEDGVEFDREAERTIEACLERLNWPVSETQRRNERSQGRNETNEQSAQTRNDIASNRPESNAGASWHTWGSVSDGNYLEAYRTAVVEFVSRRIGAQLDVTDSPHEPLAGYSIVVDCGAGVGALATPQVLDRLGAHVVGINTAVDGTFPARASKPTPETLADCAAFVEDGHFDLGVAHDGDADRLVVLGPNGEIIHEDTVLAVVAEWYTRTSRVSDPVVVTTPNASGRIDARVRDAGGRIERVRLGALHEGIARIRSAGNDDTSVVFAAEPWKHIHTAFGGWIDGVLSAAVVATLAHDAGGIDSLCEPVVERPYRKDNVDCPDDVKATVMDRLERSLPATFPAASVETADGIRLEFPENAWLLVRPSGTEPYIRLYAESESVDDLVSRARGVVEDAVSKTS